jgi:DNA transformation protein
MSAMTDLPNIGKVLEQQLSDVNIHTPEELASAGSREAWLRILAMDPSACYMRLCGLEGAIRGARWKDLPQDVKADLKAFYRQYKPGRA